MARTIRTSLLALLGLQQGAWALPSSKVAFLQHGLADGEDAVMHAPPAGSSRLSSITPQLLSSAIAKVMSLDARAEVDTGLPAGDIFNRPDANVLVFVDGLRPTGTASREREVERGVWWAKVAGCLKEVARRVVAVFSVPKIQCHVTLVLRFCPLLPLFAPHLSLRLFSPPQRSSIFR